MTKEDIREELKAMTEDCVKRTAHLMNKSDNAIQTSVDIVTAFRSIYTAMFVKSALWAAEAKPGIVDTLTMANQFDRLVKEQQKLYAEFVTKRFLPKETYQSLFPGETL